MRAGVVVLVAAVALVAAIGAWRAGPEPGPARAAAGAAETATDEPTAAPPTALPAVSSAAPDSGDAAPGPVAAASVAHMIEAAAGLAHRLREDGRCLAGTAAGAKDRRVAVHRWVDANGVLHFSDTPPAGGASDHRVIEVDGVPPVVVRARGHDVNLPDRLAQRVVADAQAIERAMRSALGVEGDPGLVLDIVFIRSEQAYAQRLPSPSMAGSAGAYSARERTIYVRWQDDEDIAFRILRHELTHALVHEHVGLLPVVMNEGLAGFFERLEVSGLGAQVAVGGDADRDDGAGNGSAGVDGLVDLFAHEADTFYAEGRETRYRQAFALVATLMARAEGRAAVAAVLAAQRAASCVGVAVARLLDARYPGGLARLAADWSHRLSEAPAAVHAF